MIPDAALRPYASVLIALALFGSSPAPVAGQGGGAFGFSKGRLAEIVAGKDPTPVLALGERELGEMGAFGPAAYYYLARWIDSLYLPAAAAAYPPDAAARSRLLYRMGYDRGVGMVVREAGNALIGSLSSAGLWDELLSFSSEYGKRLGVEWKSERPRLEALDSLGRNAESAALVARLLDAYPGQAAKDADALAYFAAAADLNLGKASGLRAFRRILLEQQSSGWSARSYSLARSEPKLRAAFTEDELHALAMRDAVRRKDYNAAFREAMSAPGAILSRASSQPMVADAGKAFLYSGKAAEGIPLFADLEAAALKRPVPAGSSAGIGWTALYYRSRFARVLERWKDASSLFKRAAAGAPTKADADTCLWYAADSAYAGALAVASKITSPLGKAAAESAARRALLDAIAAAAWRDSETFSDLVNILFRDALRERDWRLVDDMAARLAGKLGSDTAARVAYAAARSFELGLGSSNPAGATVGAESAAIAAKAALRFAAIADDPSAPLYYRVLSAWRAGIEPMLIPTEAESGDRAAQAEEPGEVEAFVAGMAAFGLEDAALSEAKARRANLSDGGLRRLAALFSSLRRPDCAIRLALELASRPGYEPQRSDYEQLFPRPYLDEIRALRIADRLSERLALGLVRSESLFRADIVSHAGAVGLSQLMPATAAEQAKSMRLASYDLKDPKDNLAIGLAHFVSLLGRTDGRPLRAMMAYNAGWGRLKTWTAESEDMPDDLLVEAIGIDETRQYCRNILQATVMYGRLYYGISEDKGVAELITGK